MTETKTAPPPAANANNDSAAKNAAPQSNDGEAQKKAKKRRNRKKGGNANKASGENGNNAADAASVASSVGGGKPKKSRNQRRREKIAREKAAAAQAAAKENAPVNGSQADGADLMSVDGSISSTPSKKGKSRKERRMERQAKFDPNAAASQDTSNKNANGTVPANATDGQPAGDSESLQTISKSKARKLRRQRLKANRQGGAEDEPSANDSKAPSGEKAKPKPQGESSTSTSQPKSTKPKSTPNKPKQGTKNTPAKAGAKKSNVPAAEKSASSSAPVSEVVVNGGVGAPAQTNRNVAKKQGKNSKPKETVTPPSESRSIQAKTEIVEAVKETPKATPQQPAEKVEVTKETPQETTEIKSRGLAFEESDVKPSSSTTVATSRSAVAYEDDNKGTEDDKCECNACSIM